VQLGAEWQLTYNSPDLVEAGELQGGLEPQYKALEPRIREIKDALMRVLGVESVTVMLESILPSFYYPGYGLRGVPLYLISNPEEYLRNVYSEPELGLTEAFRAVMERVRQGGVA